MYLCICVCSAITCCWADFRLRQQDLGEHRTRRSHRRTGRPASPHLQNLDRPPSTESSGLSITIVLSCCNYAPLCMPLQPRLSCTLLVTQTHIPLPVCRYVCLFLPCHLYGIHPSFLALRTACRISASQFSQLIVNVRWGGKAPLKASDG